MSEQPERETCPECGLPSVYDYATALAARKSAYPYCWKRHEPCNWFLSQQCDRTQIESLRSALAAADQSLAAERERAERAEQRYSIMRRAAARKITLLTEQKEYAADEGIAELQAELERTRRERDSLRHESLAYRELHRRAVVERDELRPFAPECPECQVQVEWCDPFWVCPQCKWTISHPAPSAPSAPALRDRLESTRAWYAARSDNTFHGDDVERDLAALLDDSVAAPSAPAEQWVCRGDKQ